jgi:hypothetical protein
MRREYRVRKTDRQTREAALPLLQRSELLQASSIVSLISKFVSCPRWTFRHGRVLAELPLLHPASSAPIVLIREVE